MATTSAVPSRRRARRGCRPLRLVPEPVPPTQRVLVHSGRPPVVASEGGPRTPTWVCGGCGARLVVGVALADLWEGVVRCPVCHRHNALEPGDTG
jgi:hypothetical protein